jgi:hypothetical protein
MNEWNTFSGRLLWAMNRAGKTNQSELARAVGVKPQSIQYLCHPESGAQGSTHTAALARELRVSADWLATGLDHAAALEPSAYALEEPAGVGYTVGTATTAPVLGTYKVSGNGEVDKLRGKASQADGHVSIPALATDIRAARIKGNALSPYAKDGQYLLLQAAPTPLPAEDVLVITLKDGRMLVRELMHQRDGSLLLLPIPGGQPEAIDLNDIEHIDAVVCVLSRRWWQGGA